VLVVMRKDNEQW